MLNKSVSYKTLLRIVGVLFILFGFYLVIRALTSQVEVSGSVQYSGSDLFWNPGEIWTYIFFGSFLPANSFLPVPFQFAPLLSSMFTPGPFFSIGMGILCLGLTFMRVRVMYWCLQVVLWFISISLWLPITIRLNNGGFEIPESFTPLLLITLALSIALLAAYKPVIHLLRKFFELIGGVPSPAHL
ncbi:MAG TPA: hypothetical protein VNG51_04135 [Ktedonobacteraceae bacterium]|nr:hypothetical protein [Ktedonobacteraceae bacterium]